MRIGAAAWIFLVTALVGGVVFILVNPPFWGNDGLSQYARAFQVSHRHFLPVQIHWYGKGESYGGLIPSNVWHLYEHAAKDLGSNPPEPARMILDPATYAALGHAPYIATSQNLIWFSNTAAYSPLPYVPAALASLLAEASGSSVGVALSMMALFCLAAYVLPTFAALVVLRASRMKWLFLALALLPPALLQSATISADSLTNGLAILFTALMAKATLQRVRLGTWETGLLYACVVALPICKPSYLVLVLLVVALRVAYVRGPGWVKWASLGASATLWGLWTVATRGIGDVLAFYRADYSDHDFGLLPMLKHTLAQPLEFAGNIVRTLVYRDNFYFLDLIGSSNVRVPSTVMVGMVVAVIVAAGWLPRFRTVGRFARWTWISIGVLSVVALFGTLYVTFTPVGFYLIDGVQGRYFFPLWPVLLLGIFSFFPLRWRSGGRTGSVVAWSVSSIAVVGVALTIFKFWYVVWVGA